MSEEALKMNTSTKPARVKKPKSKTRKIIEWILFGLFGVLFAIVIAGNISSLVHKDENYGQSLRFGVGSFVVMTTSMEPDIAKDDAIITYKEDVTSFEERLAAGETLDITFANIRVDIDFEPDTPQFKRANGGTAVVSNQIMTHRLMEIHEDTSIAMGNGRFIFITSGINHGGDYALMGQYQIFTEAQYLGTVKIVNSALGHFLSFVASPIGLIVLLLIPAGYLIVTSSMDIFKAMKEDEKVRAEETANVGRLAGLSKKERDRLKQEMLDEMMAAKKEKKDGN